MTPINTYFLIILPIIEILLKQTAENGRKLSSR